MAGDQHAHDEGSEISLQVHALEDPIAGKRHHDPEEQEKLAMPAATFHEPLQEVASGDERQQREGPR